MTDHHSGQAVWPHPSFDMQIVHCKIHIMSGTANAVNPDNCTNIQLSVLMSKKINYYYYYYYYYYSVITICYGFIEFNQKHEIYPEMQ